MGNFASIVYSTIPLFLSLSLPRATRGIHKYLLIYIRACNLACDSFLRLHRVLFRWRNFLDRSFIFIAGRSRWRGIDWRTTDERLCIESVMFNLSELSEFCYLVSRIILDLYIDNYIGLHQYYFPHVHILSEFNNYRCLTTLI